MNTKIQSPVVFRGEKTGNLRETGGFLRPYFFAEQLSQAELYAGKGTHPVACKINGRILDLTDIESMPSDSDAAQVIQALREEYDDWTDRYSGEPCDAAELIQAGTLYDYEGTGSADRWNTLFRIAIESFGFDAVRTLDRTDGTNGIETPIWVTFDRANIEMASEGENLRQRLAQCKSPAEEKNLLKWLEDTQPSILSRITRLRIVDEEFSFTNMKNLVPKNILPKGANDFRLALFRGCPQGTEIRPGDWVSLEEEYAAQHTRDDHIATLSHVDAQDVFWAGTDTSEYFYMPTAWRKEAPDTIGYLRQLTPEQVEILGNGEMFKINTHKEHITSVQEHVLSNYNEQACGEFHGPDHWKRVATNAILVSRSEGVDPYLPYLFAWVHDSQRENDDYDPEHGPRAAAFLKTESKQLFAFLSPVELNELAHACELHSDGHVDGTKETKASWDADRLDLWRVGIQPTPKYLCTRYAKDPHVIRASMQLSTEDSIDDQAFDRMR